MNRITLACDCDDVLVDLLPKTVSMYNQIYRKALTVNSFADYDIYKCLPYEEAEKFTALWGKKELWDTIEPLPDAQVGIKRLMDMGVSIYVATATSPANFSWKCDLLRKYFPMIPTDNIIRINNKGLLNVDIMIDDHIDNLLANKLCHRILFDCCWNKDVYDDAHFITRVHNWDEIIEVVNKISKE